MKVINYRHAIEVIPADRTINNKPRYVVFLRYFDNEFNKFCFVELERFDSSSDALTYINRRG